MNDALPAISVERFSVEMPRFAPRARQFRGPRSFLAPLERAARCYESRIGAYRSFSPRLESRVEQRTDRDVDQMVRAIGLRFEYDPIAHEFRAPARLHVRWSWPSLPVWLAVSDVAGHRSAVSVRLRSRRRLRYPRRYYAAAHDLLRSIRSG